MPDKKTVSLSLSKAGLSISRFRQAQPDSIKLKFFNR
jgi:hypothetical protein